MIRRFICAILLLRCMCCAAQDLNAPITNLVPIDPVTKAGFMSQDATRRSWILTQPQTHHAAVVRVSVPNAGGSGCIIKTDGKGAFVITNHHVVSTGWTGNGFRSTTFPRATIIARDATFVASVVYADPEKDVAILYSSAASSKHAIPISNVMPSIGTTVELCGFGGPTNQLRTFAGKRIASSYALSIATPVVSGDSGGPILMNGCLIGVLWGAAGSAGNAGSIEGWNKTAPATSSVDADDLRMLCGDVFRRFGCRPVICNPAGCDQSSSGVAPLPEEPQVIAGPQGPAGPPGKDAEIDYEKLAAEVAKRLPPFYPQWIDKDGNVIDEIKSGVRLGQTFPMRAEVIDNDKKQ